jgi:hypothetical protein
VNSEKINYYKNLNAECRMQTAESRKQKAECRMQNAECKKLKAES